RIIGKYSGGKKGSLLFVTCGIHGNEPGGIIALEKVFKELEQTKPMMEGTILGVAGNIAALNKNQRYIDEDLNRTWTKENIEKKKKGSHEQKEMYEIIEVLNRYP